MADYSCDFCAHNNQCPHAYDHLECYVETIKAARAIVDDEFQTFLAKLEEKNEDLCDENIDILIRYMRDLICNSEQLLPDWATQEVKE